MNIKLTDKINNRSDFAVINKTVIKRDGSLQLFDKERIISAIKKAGGNQLIGELVAQTICERIENGEIECSVEAIEQAVVSILIDTNNKSIAISYEGYRAIQEYKRNMELRSDFDDILNKPNRENANKNSYLISAKKGHILDAFVQNEMLTHVLPRKLAEAHKDNKIKFHDLADRYFGGINCCLFDMKNVIENNPIINGLKYDDADSIEAYLGILSDVLLEASSQQYGGFTINEIDHVLEDVLELSYQKSIQYYTNILGDKVDKGTIEELATKFIERAFRKRWNGIETRLNSISNSNMQVPFETISLGNRTTKWARFVTRIILETRLKGCGKLNQTAIFPKIVFFYREEIHGEGGINEDLYKLAIECRAKRNYPDMLSLDAGYCGEIWKKYHFALAPMGCVDGKEIITYKLKEKLYVESFERMWNRLSKIFEVKEQNSKNNYYMDLIGVSIYDTKNGFVNTKRIIKNKDKGDWVRIKFSNGRSLLATSDHPLPIINKGRTFVRDLDIGDKININQKQYSEESIIYDEDKAWLLGFILCDGCYDRQLSSSIALTGEDDIEENYKNVFKKIYNLDVETIVWNRGKRGNYKELKIKTGNYKEVQNELLQTFGGLQKKYRQIPNEVFLWNRNAKLSFLAGMIDADGYINSTTYSGSIVQLGSTNKELALQTMALSQSLGFPTKIYLNHYNSKDKNKIRYRVEFSATIELLQHMSCNKKIDCFTKEANITLTNEATVTNIEFLGNIDKCSYDVTTESDYFEVSGIYSHNCRAYLSPYVNKKGETVFNGRANCGAITINTVRPALMFKDTQNKEDYFTELKKYFDLATEGHLWQFERMKNIKASSNPLFFCMGGCHVKLDENDTIEKAIKTFTWSYGYIGLNEASILMTGKEIHEDNSFAIEVLEHLVKWKDEAIEKHGLMFAIYGTPAEKYAETCRDKEYERFGEIPRITDKKYFMNSFHTNVTAKIDPFTKMEIEKPMFDLSYGGHIFYSEYPINHNIEAISQVTRHAMKMGLYEGINFDSAICENCGKEILDYDKTNPVCTHCGSHKIIVTDRVCGYLSYFVIDGDTRANDGKVQEDQQREVHYGREVERGIHDFEVLNGDGLRVSVWFTGCPHHCEDCHNQYLWKHDEQFKLNQNKIIELCKERKKLSILGGEPFAPYNRDELLELLQKVRQEVSDCSIYIWTGYEYDEIKDLPHIKYINKLICGKYEKDKKCDNPMYGSSNQYIVDLNN